MAAIFIDGCDHYNTSILQAGTGPYQVVSGFTVNATAGRFGGPCLDGPGFVQRILNLNPQTIIQGCWVKENSGSHGGNLFAHAIPGSLNKCVLSTNELGGFSLTAGNNTALGTSVNTLFPFNQWNWVVWKIVYNTSGGTSDVFVNGTNVWSLTGLNTAQDFAGNTLYANSLKWVNDGSFVHRFVDDLFIFDNTGTTCNSVPSPQRVLTSFVSGAGAFAQFTATGAASNWQAVSDVSPDEDTSYNGSLTINNRDSFVHGTVSGITGVTGAQISIRAKVDDAGAHTMSITGTSSGTDLIGTAQTISSTYAEYLQDFSLNPNTSAAWASLATINASEIGYKLVS